MSAPRSRRPALFIAVTAALTAGALALVVWHPFPLGADGWVWRSPPSPSLCGAGEPLAVFALVLAVVALAWRRIGRVGWPGEAGLVALVAALAFLAQLAVARQSPSGYLESILAIAKPAATRYHVAARRVERLAPVLGRYERWMRDSQWVGDDQRGLIVTHPAGPLSLFWCLNHVFADEERPRPDGTAAVPRGPLAGRRKAEGATRFIRWCEQTLSWGLRLEDVPAAARLVVALSPAERAGAWLASLLTRLMACLVVPPVYLLCRGLYGRRAGLLAAALSAAVPSMLLFSPGLDQCFPAVAVTACALSLAAGVRRSGWRAALAGLAVSAGLFFSLAFAVVALWAFLLAIAGLRRGEGPTTRANVLRLGAFAAGGFALPVVLLYVAFGYHSFAVWWACWQANAAFNAQSGRVYWKWLLINPVDFLGFVGVPVACLFVRRVASEVCELWRRRLVGRDWPALTAAGLLVTLNVLGGNRGEVARLWMFLMPAAVVAAAGELGRYRPYRRVVFIVLFALQCVQVVVFKGFLSVLLGLYRPPAL